ncbi:MAG TPA: c-type cytochrome [Chthonomonadales bacterium]|nr:c-type cytochrome [Chthonomonadales bacterium]
MSKRWVGSLLLGLALAASLMASGAHAGQHPAHKKPVKKSTKKAVKKGAGAPNAAMIALGKKQLASNGCVNCHAIHGKGGTSGPDLTKTGAEKGHTAQWFEVQISTPKKHNPDSTMPPFSGRIKGKDLTALADYLTTLKK